MDERSEFLLNGHLVCGKSQMQNGLFKETEAHVVVVLLLFLLLLLCKDK